MVNAVVRGAGKEELQRTSDFLSQALHKRLEHARGVVLRQLPAALLGFRLLRRKTVLAGNQLGQLCPAESLIALIQHIIVAQHLHAGRHGSYFKQRHHRIPPFIGQT